VDQSQSATLLTTTELTTTPTYAGCQAFGQAATIDTNGCKFTVTNKSGAGVTTALQSYIDITGCTTGKVIEITPQLNCLLTIPEQHNLGHVGFTNEGTAPNEDVKLTATVTGIKYQSHNECPSMADKETRTDGTNNLTQPSIWSAPANGHPGRPLGDITCRRVFDLDRASLWVTSKQKDSAATIAALSFISKVLTPQKGARASLVRANYWRPCFAGNTSMTVQQPSLPARESLIKNLGGSIDRSLYRCRNRNFRGPGNHYKGVKR
jgi:hypothetical protein